VVCGETGLLDSNSLSESEAIDQMMNIIFNGILDSKNGERV
jgi:hypothetical protein